MFLVFTHKTVPGIVRKIEKNKILLYNEINLKRNLGLRKSKPMLQSIKLITLCIAVFFSMQVFADQTNDKGKNKEQKEQKEQKVQKEQDVSNFLKENSELQFTFLFPIIEDKIQLKVTVPKNFKALEGDPNAELLEFIPKTDEDPDKWSEILTLNKILGIGVTAPYYIENLGKLYLKPDAINTKIIETNKHNFDKYQDASSIIKYQGNGRDEVVILYSVSGPLDIANVQYALPLPSPEALDETIRKLKEFIKNNVEVIKNNSAS